MRQRELYTLSKRIRKINRADQELWMRGVIIYPLIIGLSCMDGVTLYEVFFKMTESAEKEALYLLTVVHLSSKSRHKKAQLTEAQFGPVLNWASIAQSSSQTAVIEEVDVGVQQSWNIFCVGQIEVEEQFFFDPSVQSFYDRVICWSSYSRHGAKYVIILVGLAKSP